MQKFFAIHVVIAGMLVAGLTITASEPAWAQGFLKRKQVCSEQQEPVCARTRRKVLATYPNECYAQNDRAVVIAKGACPNVGCQMVWIPVCARKGGKNATYSNVCLAEKDSAAVIAPGQCPEICAALNNPVCAVDDAGKRGNYRSACEAVKAGARVLHPRDCLGERPCAQGGRGVCALDPQSKKAQSYPTLCDAERANATLIHDGNCRDRR
jgi:hypothetical protein